MKNELFEGHLEQQLIVELWCQNRGIDNLEVPDFTDYVFRDKQAVGDYMDGRTTILEKLEVKHNG